MILNERDKSILDIINQSGYATIEEISKELYISASTVRRELAKLENGGFLRRTHGGATMILQDHEAISFNYRTTVNTEGKQRMAKEAIKLVDDGMHIFMDSATTILTLANEMVKKNNLQILTNNLGIAQIVTKNPSNNAEVTCGSYNVKHNNLCGSDTVDYILTRHADIMFASATGLDDDGVTTTIKDDIGPKHAFLRNADLIVLLMDHQKFNETNYYRVFSYDDIDILIVDEELPDNLAKRCKEHQVRVIVAK